MQIVLFFHNRLSITALLFMIALGLWGLWLFLQGQGISGSYQGALVIGEALLVGEALLGMLLLLSGGVAARSVLHLLYGSVAVLALPSAFAFTRGRNTRYEALIYALIAFFIAGVTVRARLTGGA